MGHREAVSVGDHNSGGLGVEWGEVAPVISGSSRGPSGSFLSRGLFQVSGGPWEGVRELDALCPRPGGRAQ